MDRTLLRFIFSAAVWAGPALGYVLPYQYAALPPRSVGARLPEHRHVGRRPVPVGLVILRAEEGGVGSEVSKASSEPEQLPLPVRLPCGDSYSTLTLLEHVHLLVPDAHSRGVASFFVDILGFGLDPRSAGSIRRGSGVAFVNAGPSQLHLNDDADYCEQDSIVKAERERIRGFGGPSFEVGLKYGDVRSLKERLDTYTDRLDTETQINLPCHYNTTLGSDGREAVRITDAYGNIFVARGGDDTHANRKPSSSSEEEPQISSLCQQKGQGDDADKCRGIDYVEFFVPVSDIDGGGGKTAEKIARFYEFFFDAPATAVVDPRDGSGVAIVGFGKVDANGRAEQTLLFREVAIENEEETRGPLPLAGHHVSMYVGSNAADFEVASTNFQDGGLMWVNPRFEDRVLDVASAVELGQFRFKDIIDIQTGDVLYTLEHEVRSVDHSSFPMR